MAAGRALIVALHVSGAHAYEGRPSDGPRADQVPVSRDHVVVRAGLGLVGTGTSTTRRIVRPR
ncbi:hypothetical protein [Amycolatopsis sp. cmx-11-12]|uniref:hypothetical protein n=1 Tax=Amycolatopsis sp. cmx-11-12 TaxID=2785795 RepID=UPI003917FE35